MAYFEMRSAPQVVQQQRTTLYQVQAHTAENLNAHTKILSNGALGINFHELAAPNLAQSAVLRMLEEEEKVGGEHSSPRSAESSPFCRRRSNRAWPPVTPPASPPTRRRLGSSGSGGGRASPALAWPPAQNRFVEPRTVPSPLPTAEHYDETPPGADHQQFSTFAIPNSIRSRSFSPAGFFQRPPHTSFYTGGNKRVAWPPTQEQTVAASAIEQQLVFPKRQGDLEAHPPATLLYSPPPPEAGMEANTCVFTIPTASSTAPPATIPLRPAPPMSQPPAPVVRSEPALPEAAFNNMMSMAPDGAAPNGGSHLRGDNKWPPTSVRVQREAEREQQAAIARGPAVRPRRPQKDYTSFFEQNRLQGTGTHYRPPPGTQHYPVA